MDAKDNNRRGVCRCGKLARRNDTRCDGCILTRDDRIARAFGWVIGISSVIGLGILLTTLN